MIWGLVFIIGLQCGIEGAYFTRSVGTPAYAGVFSAWCDLRELVPYAFGYMMAAKVGTGIVAELGSMRISDEIDALEVMGIDSMTFLCATRLLAAWMVLPFMYIAAVGAGFFASYLAVVAADRRGVVRRVLPDLLDVPEPTGPALQRDQGHGHGHGDRARRLLLRLQRRRRPGRGGNRHREVDGAQHRARAPHRDARHPGLLGRQSRAPRSEADVPATLTRTTTLPPPPPLPRLPVEIDEGAARQALRGQLSALERRLAATGEPLPAPRVRGGAPRLLDLAALERARDDLYTRVRAAERSAVEREAAHAAARARLEAMLADPAAHRWERVSRAQLGEPGCGDWHVRPRAGLLGMLAGWWEVKLSSGCPLPARLGRPVRPRVRQRRQARLDLARGGPRGTAAG